MQKGKRAQEKAERKAWIVSSLFSLEPADNTCDAAVLSILVTVLDGASSRNMELLPASSLNRNTTNVLLLPPGRVPELLLPATTPTCCCWSSPQPVAVSKELSRKGQ